MTPTLTFSITTIPDTDGLRAIYGTDEHANAEQLAEIAFQQGRQSHEQDFLPLHLHRVAAIACTLRDDDHFHVWSLGHPHDSEAILIQHLFDIMEKHRPLSISWNGSGFDLPVLCYRALTHNLTAPRQWDANKREQHINLMHELACHQPDAHASLHDIARLCGLPATPDLAPNQIWVDWQAGKQDSLRQQNELNALNTYLLYLRFLRLRGSMTPVQLQTECNLVRASLTQLDEPHWLGFLQAWQ